MRLKLPFLLICVSFCLFFANFTPGSNSTSLSTQPDAEETWDLKKDANGIKIYTRDYPDSPVKEFLAITTCNSSLETVIAVLNDIDAYPEWFRNCKSVTNIKRANDSTVANYVEISFPWPLSNRDGIWEATTIAKNETTYITEIRSRPELVPEKKGIVRMHYANGNWKLEKLTNGQTKISQQFFADPEGNIPGWIVNLFLVDGPYDSFMNLLALLGEKR